MNPYLTALILAGAVLSGLAVRFGFRCLIPWRRARAAGVPLDFNAAAAMFVRKANISLLADAMIDLRREGVAIDRDLLGGHYYAKGDVPALTRALIAAHREGITVEPRGIAAHILAGGSADNVIRTLVSAKRDNTPVTFDEACVADLAGRRAR